MNTQDEAERLAQELFPRLEVPSSGIDMNRQARVVFKQGFRACEKSEKVMRLIELNKDFIANAFSWNQSRVAVHQSDLINALASFNASPEDKNG